MVGLVMEKALEMARAKDPKERMALVPAVVERLGDSKQPVRDAARRLLTTLMEVSSPTIIVERAGSYGWMHKIWRVREEFACTVTSAIGLFASTELPLQRAILAPILQMLNDPNQAVREAAILCIEARDVYAGWITISFELAILDEIDSGLDVDALQDVAKAVNGLLTPKNSVLMITHYQRLLDYIKPTLIHIMVSIVVKPAFFTGPAKYEKQAY